MMRKIIRQMSRVSVLLGDWEASLSWFSYIHSSREWKAFVRSEGWATYGYIWASFCSRFSGFPSITASAHLGQLLQAPDKAVLVCHEGWKMKIYLALPVICSKWPLFWALSKSCWLLLPSKKRKHKRKASQMHLSVSQKGPEGSQLLQPHPGLLFPPVTPSLFNSYITALT